jgi:hypothetical protein
VYDIEDTVYAFLTLGSMTADAAYGSDDAAPELIRDKRDGGWRLWETIAAKADDCTDAMLNARATRAVSCGVPPIACGTGGGLHRSAGQPVCDLHRTVHEGRTDGPCSQGGSALFQVTAPPDDRCAGRTPDGSRL